MWYNYPQEAAGSRHEQTFNKDVFQFELSMDASLHPLQMNVVEVVGRPHCLHQPGVWGVHVQGEEGGVGEIREDCQGARRDAGERGREREEMEGEERGGEGRGRRWKERRGKGKEMERGYKGKGEGGGRREEW